MSYKKEYLVNVLKKIYKEENEVPTKRYINSKKDLPSDMAFRKCFGSWSNALKEAGIEPIKPHPSQKCIENCIKAHKNKRGFNNRGERRVNVSGYVEIWNPNHPNSRKSGYILEHRLVMSNYLGRPLLKNEDVHHKDGNKQNNDIKNLELLTKSSHTKIHNKQDKNKHKRKIQNKCKYPNCNIMTASKYELCTKHYKLQWQRKRDKLIDNIEVIGTIFDEENRV